jgi:phosphotransferase system IIB component
MDLILMNFNEFNASYWWVYIILALLVIGLICLIVIKNKKNKKIKAEEVELVKKLSGVYDLLGGKDNVISHNLNGSRLTVVLKDYSKVDEPKLKEIGVERILTMSNKMILVGKDLKRIEESLN